MFLEEVTSTEVQRDINAVFEKAYKNPILIRRQKRKGKMMDDAIMMSKSSYEQLIKNATNN